MYDLSHSLPSPCNLPNCLDTCLIYKSQCCYFFLPGQSLRRSGRSALDATCRVPLGSVERLALLRLPLGARKRWWSVCLTVTEVLGLYRMTEVSKGKGKGRLWILQHSCLEAYCTLTRMSSFIHLQRRCTHQAAWETSASEGRNYTWNLAHNP